MNGAVGVVDGTFAAEVVPLVHIIHSEGSGIRTKGSGVYSLRSIKYEGCVRSRKGYFKLRSKLQLWRRVLVVATVFRFP